ncbi:uncharacterized protein TNCV_4337681 [Trichonephila clavipes]|uniref:Tc1-like transposase DDE domain-containing protein n=1 Tax=Trichonephila clavipes TaxID=2585209 RepID=A0A8X6SWL7_TRICX|nr:uncharacterized protein TNCV_4337681 [Trichonephila clavipes]
MYSIEERVFLVLEYHRLQESPTATRPSFQARFNVPKGPDAKTIPRRNTEKEPTHVSIETHHAVPVRAVQQRDDFANQMLTMIDSEGFDVGCIWFTDEAHFHLNGFVNKQNWRFWGSENPYWCEVKPLYSPKVTVWAAQVLENRPRTEWFMQDGARPHRTEQVFRFLDEYFGNRVIVLEYPKFAGAGMDWPPYSPDLTL